MKSGVDVFPAPAGINRWDLRFDEYWSSVPRASGDKPFEFFGGWTGYMCSPRQRG